MNWFFNILNYSKRKFVSKKYKQQSEAGRRMYMRVYTVTLHIGRLVYVQYIKRALTRSESWAGIALAAFV